MEIALKALSEVSQMHCNPWVPINVVILVSITAIEMIEYAYVFKENY